MTYCEFEIEDGDGATHRLASEQHQLMEISGLGMPPLRRWVTRSPGQQGQTHWGYAFQARPVDIILALTACNRGQMYARRKANIEMLNPMNGPLKLRLKVPQENLVYELHDGWYNNGYELSSADQSSGDTRWNQIGSPSLIFDDPIWKWTNSPLGGGETRDADGRTCLADSTWTLAGAMVLPVAGPYLLGTTYATNSLTCTNDGSWSSRPLITVLGPINDWVLYNATTAQYLIWDGYAIAGAETVTIDIRGKTCVSSVVGDVSAYLTGDTGSFTLDPGANIINVFASGGVTNAVTTVTVCWFLEFLGT